MLENAELEVLNIEGASEEDIDRILRTGILCYATLLEKAEDEESLEILLNNLVCIVECASDKLEGKAKKLVYDAISDILNDEVAEYVVDSATNNECDDFAINYVKFNSSNSHSNYLITMQIAAAIAYAEGKMSETVGKRLFDIFGEIITHPEHLAFNIIEEE